MNLLTENGRRDRDCDLCGRTMADGPDACLGYIPGVSHACCGHGGGDSAPYVVLGGQPNQDCLDGFDRITLRDQDALDFFRLLGRGPA